MHKKFNTIAAEIKKYQVPRYTHLLRKVKVTYILIFLHKFKILNNIIIDIIVLIVVHNFVNQWAIIFKQRRGV